MLGQRASRCLRQLPEWMEKEQRQDQVSSGMPPNGPAAILPTPVSFQRAPQSSRRAYTHTDSFPTILVKEDISPGLRKKVLLSIVLGCSKIDCFQDTAPG